MGDFEHHVPRTLHTIHVSDAAGRKLAAISIGADVERVESWEHLDGLAEPAGPHNREIVDVQRGYFVYGHVWGGSPDPQVPLPAGLDEVVARLKADEGVRCADALLGFDDPGFREACAAWITAETGTQATFVEDPFAT